MALLNRLFFQGLIFGSRQARSLVMLALFFLRKASMQMYFMAYERCLTIALLIAPLDYHQNVEQQRHNHSQSARSVRNCWGICMPEIPRALGVAFDELSNNRFSDNQRMASGNSTRQLWFCNWISEAYEVVETVMSCYGSRKCC